MSISSRSDPKNYDVFVTIQERKGMLLRSSTQKSGEGLNHSAHKTNCKGI